MLTIRPRASPAGGWPSICATAARHSRYGPRPGPLHRELDQPPAVLLPRHVRVDVHRAAAAGSDQLGGRLAARDRVAADVGHEHVEAVVGQADGDRAPDAGRRAGDDRGPPGHGRAPILARVEPPSAPPFAGRRLLVTGAASGIGRATAERLAAAGAAVACVDVDGDGLAGTVAAIAGAGGHALPLAADVAERAAVERAVDAAA